MALKTILQTAKPQDQKVKDLFEQQSLAQRLLLVIYNIGVQEKEPAISMGSNTQIKTDRQILSRHHGSKQEPNDSDEDRCSDAK